jgi:glutaredoxin-like YruB-family protein
MVKIFQGVDIMSDIKVYSTPTCPWCVKLKDYLKSRDVDFENIDVSADREAAMEMVKKTGQMGVPVAKIGDVYIVGFDQARIDEELKKLG